MENTNNLYTTKRVADLMDAIEKSPARSAWARGVKEYAVEILEDYTDGMDPAETYLNAINGADLLDALLNGAPSWADYSSGGCALIYDGEIAARLCTPSELVKTRGGEREPNARESWIDVQTRAIIQAANLIRRVFFE